MDMWAKFSHMSYFNRIFDRDKYIKIEFLLYMYIFAMLRRVDELPSPVITAYTESSFQMALLYVVYG